MLAGLTVPLVCLVVLVSTRYGPLMSFDADVVASWNGSIQHTGWVDFFQFVARASGGLVTTPLAVAIFVWLLIRRRVRLACWVLTVTVVGHVWAVMKQVIERPRPTVADQISGYSFPSGHSTSIALTMGVLAVFTVGVQRSGLRRSLFALEVAAVLLVGADRVFLGAHNPDDVVAGWLLGALVVYGSALAFGALPTRARSYEQALTASERDDRRSLAVILHPIKIGDSERFKAKVSQAARAAGWDQPLWFETTVDDAGASMARAAVAAGADLVVAAGGDGTVRVVCSEMAGSGIPVGVIPAGTGNLLARNLGISLQHDLAIETVLRGQDRAIDVVRVEGDELASTRFLVMAGLGLDAAIMDGAPDALKARIGWPAYVVAGARQLRYPAIRVDISVDGAEPVRRRARTVVIGNVGSLQAGIPLLPDAKIDDGVIDVVVVAPRRLSGWLPLLVRVLSRGRRTDEHLDRFTGRSVVVTTPHATPRQLDGDIVGPGTQIRAEIEPGRLLVRVPRSWTPT